MSRVPPCIASSTAFLAVFNAIIFGQLLNRWILTAELLRSRSRDVRTPVVFIAAGTLGVLLSLYMAVDTILLFQEGVRTAASTTNRFELTRKVFDFGYIASFLGFPVLEFRAGGT